MAFKHINSQRKGCVANLLSPLIWRKRAVNTTLFVRVFHAELSCSLYQPFHQCLFIYKRTVTLKQPSTKKKNTTRKL